MGTKESTVRMRKLGLALREAMTAAGLDNKTMAHRLECSQSKISNMLGAKRGVSAADIATFLTICDVPGGQRARLLALARDAHQPGWWHEHGDHAGGGLRTLVDHESAAFAISQFQSTEIPSLLQVRDYARTRTGASVLVAPEQKSALIAAQARRQEVLNRGNPPLFEFFLDEHVLRPANVGRAVMSEQLHHLLRLSVRPTVRIRVIPEAAGFHAGSGGPFTLMEFAEFGPVVHYPDSGLFAERPESVSLSRAHLATLAELAFDGERSRAWLSRRARELGTGGAEPVQLLAL